MSFQSKCAVIVSDLDGCLLDSSYSFQEAEPALRTIHELQIPLILASSKTEAEMLPIAESVGTDWPIICENGGLVSWRGYQRKDSSEDRTIVGVDRQQILEILEPLHEKFRFRSFATMGLDGIVETTGLAPGAAALAAQRLTTEPLKWDDAETQLEVFGDLLRSKGLTFTRGGRFWHVAGKVTKGDGMDSVLRAISEKQKQTVSAVAVGDSPIDLPMLNRADRAIIVPSENGVVRIQTNHPRFRVAPQPGPAGWNAAILEWIDRYKAD